MAVAPSNPVMINAQAIRSAVARATPARPASAAPSRGPAPVAGRGAAPAIGRGAPTPAAGRIAPAPSVGAPRGPMPGPGERTYTIQPVRPGRQSNAYQDQQGTNLISIDGMGTYRPTYGEGIQDPEARRRAYEEGQRGFSGTGEGFKFGRGVAGRSFGPMQALAGEMARRRGRRMNPALSELM